MSLEELKPLIHLHSFFSLVASSLFRFYESLGCRKGYNVFAGDSWIGDGMTSYSGWNVKYDVLGETEGVLLPFDSGIVVDIFQENIEHYRGLTLARTLDVREQNMSDN